MSNRDTENAIRKECREDKIEERRRKFHEKKAEEAHNSVTKPSHYMFFDMEAIDIIKAALTEEEFRGYLKGNSLKYRLRCGKKDDAMQDLGKAQQYEGMYDE